MNEIMLFVTYTTKPNIRDCFLSELYSSGVLEEILQEDGCISYEYYLSTKNKDEILLIEKWNSEKQQKKHLNQPHMQVLRIIKERYVLNTHVEKISL